MKVALCIPVHGNTKARFTLSLSRLLIWSAANQPDTVFTLHMAIGNSRLDDAREEIAEAALRAEPDFLLWLDADHTFPPDLVARLAAHGLPIIGCNYRFRDPEAARSTAANWVEGDRKAVEPKALGVEPVDALGLGACLIKAEVFRTMKRPWFSMWLSGEDSYFFGQAKAQGFQPHVDHGLSKEVGHIAETVLML